MYLFYLRYLLQHWLLLIFQMWQVMVEAIDCHCSDSQSEWKLEVCRAELEEEQ